eukprot:GHVS01092058.1.p1 GENE.GHVS01092058.1~~GHVS01092058.1.p1  ORF type:complete len:456 (+),score=78.66 GHVS01092058.1:269-1636(+)
MWGAMNAQQGSVLIFLETTPHANFKATEAKPQKQLRMSVEMRWTLSDPHPQLGSCDHTPVTTLHTHAATGGGVDVGGGVGGGGVGVGGGFGVYHFVTRQKRHMIEQLLRNRSCYLTQFNTMEIERNRKSPFILKAMSDPVLEGLHKMSNDFDDPEFTGVWLSLHTQAFMTDTQFGNLARSKIVGWALIEVLTTNERCLKAMWVHPTLSATSATFLLRGFLPRVLLEAFQLEPPPNSSCSWKFFYTWANDFESLPRQTWLFLTSRTWLGLPRHFDVNSTQHADELLPETSPPTPPSNTGSSSLDYHNNNKRKRSDFSISTSVCGCMKNPKWVRVDEVLVGCSEAALYKKWTSSCGFNNLVPQDMNEGLIADIRDLASDPSEEDKEEVSEEALRRQELVGLNDEEVAFLLKYIWGADDAKNRVRGLDDLLKSIHVDEPGGSGENIKRVKVKQQRGPR